jgi:hypothetical protein
MGRGEVLPVCLVVTPLNHPCHAPACGSPKIAFSRDYFLKQHYAYQALVDRVRPSLNCGNQLAYCLSLMWCMSMENHRRMISKGENSWFVHQSSLAVLPAEPSSSKWWGTWQRKRLMWASTCICLYFEAILTCHKILHHGASGFTSLLKECLCGWCWTNDCFFYWWPFGPKYIWLLSGFWVNFSSFNKTVCWYYNYVL